MNEIELNGSNFEKEVINSSLPVLVDFWAAWCGPCKAIAPIVQEIANDYEGKIKVGKVNVDENNELAAKYNIMSIPSIKLFKNGKIAQELVGAAPKDLIENLVKKVL